MKSLNLAIALTFVCSNAFSGTYIWTALNENEMAQVSESCTPTATKTLLPGGLAVTAGVGSTAYLAASGRYAGSTVQASALVGFLMGALPAAGLGLFEISKYFSSPELLMLVQEQNAGRPGLISTKFVQMQEEAGRNSDDMLYIINGLAKMNQLCQVARWYDLHQGVPVLERQRDLFRALVDNESRRSHDQ